MKPILIVVSTWNRRDLTGITLDSVRRNKSACSDVLILDDASSDYGLDWLLRWDFPVLRRAERIGVGPAAQQRYVEFLRRGYAYVCALDNDVLLARHFDLKMLELFCAADDGGLTVVSGYRSTTQKVLAPTTGGYLQATTVNGISQFMDAPTADKLLVAMDGRWEHAWDHHVSKVFSQIVVPHQSWVQHLGVHGSGVNGLSEDVAVDFVGDGGSTPETQ